MNYTSDGFGQCTINQVVWTTSVQSTGPSKKKVLVCMKHVREAITCEWVPILSVFLAHQSHIRCYVHISVIYIYAFIYLFPCISYGISHCISQFCPIKLLPVLHNPLIPHGLLATWAMVTSWFMDYAHPTIFVNIDWYLVSGQNPVPLVP